MSSFPRQLQFPEGITEVDLNDLVDGALAPEREAVVLAALKQDPALRVLLRDLRADCAAVVSLGEARAPLDLADGIEARLEAEALRDLAKASVAAPVERLPVSQIETHEPGVLQFIMESVWPRRLALAASIAIVAGLATLGVRELMRAPVNQPGVPPIVRRADPAPGLSPTPEPSAEPVAVASGEPVAAPVEPIVVPELPAAPAVAAISPERAVQLAREGRLVVSVRTREAQPSIRRLDVLAKAAGREGGWQTIPLASVPTQYAALLTPSMDAPQATPAGRPAAPLAVAGQDAAPAPTVITDPPPPMLPALRPAVKALYTVEIGPTDRGVQSLIRSITDGLPEGATLVLREVAQAPVAEVSLDPESVLWWTGTPSRWTRKTKVPVVIEGLE